VPHKTRVLLATRYQRANNCLMRHATYACAVNAKPSHTAHERRAPEGSPDKACMRPVMTAEGSTRVVYVVSEDRASCCPTSWLMIALD